MKPYVAVNALFLLFLLANITHRSSIVFAAEPRQALVQLGSSQVVGAFSQRQSTVAQFLGIPYAYPPTGNLRWQAPRPFAWQQDRLEALAFGPACVQSDYTADWYARVAQSFGAVGRPLETPPVNEDCLSLNIWTPSLDAQALQPVMVWIHGGSNIGGWSYEPNYLGDRLAVSESVVVVSINYRLGVFGFFDYWDRPDGSAVNFALLDQIAALEWVQQHIAAFGGDPSRVTLFGESAGAANIGYLVTSPVAGKLFHRAISQSGGFQFQDRPGPGVLKDVGEALAHTLATEDVSIDALRKLSADELLSAQQGILANFEFQAEAGKPELPLGSADFFRNQPVPVDILLGTNRNEWYMYNDTDPQKLEIELARFSPQARQLLVEKLAAIDDVRHARDVVRTLAEMTCPGYFMAEQTSLSNRKAWVYRFDRVRSGVGGSQLLAYHGAEIPYVFNTHDEWLPTTQEDTTLSTLMMRYWANFARTGNPNDGVVPEWREYSEHNPSLHVLHEAPHSIEAPDHLLCRELDPVLWR